MSESHHRHHRRRKSRIRIIKHRIKRWLYKYRWMGPTIIVAAVIIAATGVWLLNTHSQQDSYHVSSKSRVNVGSGYRNVTYKGKKYHYNNRITTIVYAGIDSTDALQATRKYTFAPRADGISVVVLDELNKRLSIIALSRDTMTPIRKYTLNGQDRGLFRDHLGYAYTYGDGGKVSCRNLCEAISNLFYGIPITDYMITNLSAMYIISNVIGPVTLTVPNDDLIDIGIAKGQTITVDSTNLETFVRTRDIEEHYSNVGRMERQQAYISAASAQILTAVRTTPDDVWQRVLQAEDSIQMSVTRNRYLDLTNALKKVTYDAQNYYTLEGEQVAGVDHDEFIPDEDALLDLIVDLFYIAE